MTFTARGMNARMPEPVETTLYRVAQEAVGNAVRHAEAEAVEILLERKGPTITLLVTDDGNGFDAHAVAPDRFGLIGMRERMALIDGTLRIDSRRGAGTTVTAMLEETPNR